MTPALWIMIVGCVMIFAGDTAQHFPKYTAHGAFLSSFGLTVIGVMGLLDTLSIISVALSGLCFLLALLIILRESVRTRKERLGGEHTQ